jgi:hypothetical protein
MQEQKQRQTRPKCLVKDCIAKACPSGTGYCSRHDWERTPLGARPTKGIVGAVASQKREPEKQNPSVVRSLPLFADDDENEPTFEKAKTALAAELDSP